MSQSVWQQRVFQDVLKERRYQERKWGQNVDDTLNTPWMWCAYLTSYATKWMKDPWDILIESEGKFVGGVYFKRTD